MTRSLKTCRGDFLPDMVRWWDGLEIVILDIISLHLGEIKGCDHRSRSLVAPSQFEMGSAGVRRHMDDGPEPLLHISREAAATLRHCSGDSGAQVMMGCCSSARVEEMTFGGLFKREYRARDSGVGTKLSWLSSCILLSWLSCVAILKRVCPPSGM